MIALMLVVVLFACSAALILVPLRRSNTRSSEPDTARSDEIERADLDKRSALEALVEVDEDHATGKLSTEDFVMLKTEYEKRALTALKALDVARARAAGDDDIEREIAAIRAQLACPSCGGLRSGEGVCPRCDAAS